MFGEAEKGNCVASLHDIDYNFNAIPLTPRIMREYENIYWEENTVVVGFKPVGAKNPSIGSFLKRRPNDNYKDYSYCEEWMCIVTIIAHSANGYSGRELADEWLRRIEIHIRNTWNTLGAFIRENTFSGHIEEPHFYAGEYYVYSMNFRFYTNHDWTDEPEQYAKPSVPVIGADVNGVYFKVI